ncbi:MAG: hypothetical protein JXB04_13595, partial [Kiritimatiellae bacterium]|nr:hypothetical protein [Kiritimatiellia bacterium]
EGGVIVPMKRLTVLCVASDQDRTLKTLRKLGVLHLSHVRAPEGEDLEKARTHLTYVRRALEVLPRGAEQKPSGMPAMQVVEEIWRVIHRKKDLEERIEDLRHERDRIEPFGSFDPAGLAALKDKGVTIRLLRIGPRREIAAPAGVVVRELRRDRGGAYLVAIGRGEFEIEGDEIQPPAASLDDLDRQIAETGEALAECARKFALHAGDSAAVQQIVEGATETVRYLEARCGMGSTEPLRYLQGYCPADTVGAVRDAAAREGWGLLVNDPAPDDPVPTLLRTPAWVRPIKSLYQAFSLTLGYDEADISPVFLVFFCIFFGMLVGDAGYGLLFLVATLVARYRYRKLPAPLAALLVITSLATIAWGILTGVYFGIAPLPAPLQSLKITWLEDPLHMMDLCFFIGAIHLTIAHGWRLVILAQRRSLQAIAQAGWICSTWGMLFLARYLILSHEMYPAMWGLLLVGVVAVATFMTPWQKMKTDWFNHAMLPLTVISNFVDVVSYLRLFAVGAATLAVASAGNYMAALFPGYWRILSPLVLLFGHSLNMGMAVLGVMVHGIRLNTLEFSQHAEIAWKGVPYDPFRERDRNVTNAA